MNHEQLLQTMQHTPFPERMAGFERTRSPQDPQPLAGGGWLIVEYKHLSEDVRFQVLIEQTGEAALQVQQDGHVTPLQRMSVEEAGHVLRRDLLMILEEIEDEL
ncbi:hypothetical protein OS242_07500 [Tumebacillus sp. DT12]|uniref:Uncharacterized protein n=1 Tax=Tumebacillus lacus TaxID=2995335 RepID=A0ABT3WYR8_9BACL|nr:hypothetical protein [Tumebacillus lacus]MCX7569807.1 hypothetical protein [Tumebacillus lacus]